MAAVPRPLRSGRALLKCALGECVMCLCGRYPPLQPHEVGRIDPARRFVRISGREPAERREVARWLRQTQPGVLDLMQRDAAELQAFIDTFDAPVLVETGDTQPDIPALRLLDETGRTRT